jgi:hypothetical protein
MKNESIREGFDAFVHDGETSFGAVRQVRPHGRAELVIYVENAGDFTVPLTAVAEVHDKKVVLDCGRLDMKLKSAIGHAHSGEDGTFVDHSRDLKE